jgi:hypothetical protein
MKKLWMLIATLITSHVSFCQQNFYDVTQSNGYGVRFWSSDNYKIHMGYGSEYQYGPVTDFSIKTNMSANAGRGWTWGTPGATPIAALNNVGNMQIAGTFQALNIDISSSSSDLSIVKLRNSTWACNQRTAIEFWNGGLKNYATSRIVSQMDGCGSQGEALIFETQKAGETSPSSKLIIKNDGNVGIGTSAPDNLLQIHSSNNPTLSIGKGNFNTTGKSSLLFNAGDGAAANGFLLTYNKTTTTDRFSFIDGGGVEDLTVVNGGNIGIGTTSPDAKLTVKGDIHTREVRVDMTGAVGPDYVFEKNYNLLPLTQLESYINQNKHLPEVPSAKEMEENGLNLKEMNLILLKKVEELTLHLIDQNRKIKEQGAQIEVHRIQLEDYQAELQQLKSKIK